MRNGSLISAVSLALMATAPLAAQAQYAYVGTYNPNGEGVCRFQVDPVVGSSSQLALTP